MCGPLALASIKTKRRPISEQFPHSVKRLRDFSRHARDLFDIWLRGNKMESIEMATLLATADEVIE
jgi:hypothetical protein